MPITIRNYHLTDERSWLRCRTLSFLDTCYYDDVWTTRPDSPAVQLVVIEGGEVIGLLDLEVEGALATIDTVAVHPDHQGNGVASALLAKARDRLPHTVTTLDAWTREDNSTLTWYGAGGFVESDHYLHVYKGGEESDDGWVSPDPLSAPVTAFCHARLEDEADVRARFARVYVCRRFSQPMPRH